MEAKLTIFLGGYAMLDLLSLFWNLIKNLYTKILLITIEKWDKKLKLISLKNSGPPVRKEGGMGGPKVLRCPAPFPYKLMMSDFFWYPIKWQQPF